MTTDQDLESHLTLVYHHEVIDIGKHSRLINLC
jgi:hypothetical protein